MVIASKLPAKSFVSIFNTSLNSAIIHPEMLVSREKLPPKVRGGAQIIFIENRQELLEKDVKTGKIGRLLREILIVNIVDIL